MREGADSPHYSRERDFAVALAPAQPGLRRMIDHGVPLADGTLLSANIYLPADDGAVPMICAMTIYRKEEHQKHYAVFDPIANTHLGVMRFSQEATFEGPDPAYWCAHGYGVIHVDARGFGKSPGIAKPFSLAAFEDYRDIVEWVADQPWCNGKVATSGVSYLGTSQYFLAALRPRGLCAINPWDARTDRFRSDYLGGIPNTYMSRWIFENFTIPSLNDPAHAEGMRAFTDIAGAPRLIDAPYHAEKLALLAMLPDVSVPTLIGGSISDQAKHTRDAFENFMAIGAADKWLYIHRDPEWAAYYDDAGLALQRRFFDHVVKGIDNGWDETPRVFGKVFASLRHWVPVAGPSWPLPQAGQQHFHLGADRALVGAPISESASQSYDSTGSGEGPQRAEFALRFEEDVDLVGHCSLRLWVSVDEGDDADLFVGLKKLDAQGDEVFFLGESGNNPNDIVSRGWLRASHRELSPASTPFRPVLAHKRQLPLEPGVPVEVTVEIHPTSTRFLAGETLLLVIQGSSIPPSDVAIGFGEKINRGKHTIHVGGECPGWLSLPFITRKTAHAA
ncbi:CocE/NonD family hydrolase [Novosphingobium rosa]|uniref:CocE/NonD family hydrolase n=1 Tax=Novosphingobium rosa TaxID=76978 RepID=UPI00082F26A0|nr:CocE/NonD family hydrolase [Novosphingobium rosa]